MATPIIKNKRSSVAGKIPTIAQLEAGEFGINTYDGKVYIEQDQGGVGVGTTVIVVNPWNVGLGSTAYNINFTAGNVGIGTTNPSSKLDVMGTISATSYSGSGINLTGIVTSITAGTNISISTSTGNVTISATSVGGTATSFSRITNNFTATEGQTTFSVTYTPNYIDVYLNGVRLTSEEYTATNGTSVVLTVPANSGDIVDIVTFTNTGSFETSKWSSTTPNTPVTGNIYRLNGNVGIGTTNPTTTLDVVGNARISGVVTASSFVGNLNGNASTATTADTATNAINVRVATSSTNLSYKIPFAGTTASTTADYGLLQDSTATFTYNPSSNTLTAGVFSGDITITSDIATATGQPILFSNVSTGSGTVKAQSDFVIVPSTGYIGIGSVSPARTLDVIGDIRTSDQFLATKGGASGYLLSPPFSFAADPDTGIDSPTDNQIAFITNNTERMRIGGNIGIGTNSALSILHVHESSSATTPTVRIQNSSSTVSTSGAVLLDLDYSADSDVSTGTSSYFVRCQDSDTVLGGIRAASGTSLNYATTSDYRLKEDITPIQNGIERVMQLKPCEFTWKRSQVRTEGFIAHEVQEVIPDAVIGAKDAVTEEGKINPQMIDPSKMVVVLTSALQEAIQRIEYLESIVGIGSS